LEEKRILPIILLTLSLLCLRISLVFAGEEENIIRVPSDYPTIQEAINAAAPASTILVESGVYYEHVVVSKTLKLIGQNKVNTVIDGNGSGTVITLSADNVVVDGFTIRNGTQGIYINQSRNSTVRSNIVKLHSEGIILEESNNSAILNNMLTRIGHGAPLEGLVWGTALALTNSFNNSVAGNILVNNNYRGLVLGYSDNNSIHDNIIADNYEPVHIGSSSENAIHHNNFVGNSEEVVIQDSFNNTWDNGVKGNYWDSYTGLDDGSGGRVTGDGVGDTDLPYQGVDNYPLISPCGPVPAMWEDTAYPVELVSNSTVSSFRFVQADKKIAFNTRGPADTAGFCNLTIPKSLLRDNPWKILLNGTDITPQATITENQTHTTIYFNYSHSNYNIQVIGTWVIPEFPVHSLLTLILILTSIIILLKRRTIKRFHNLHRSMK